MAHRLIGNAEDSSVTLIERGNKAHSDSWQVIRYISKPSSSDLVISNGKEMRTYSVREWISRYEVRATLTGVFNEKDN